MGTNSAISLSDQDVFRILGSTWEATGRCCLRRYIAVRDKRMRARLSQGNRKAMRRVTGGSRGGGLAMPQELAAAGYRIIAMARTQDKRLQRQSNKPSAPGGARCISCPSISARSDGYPVLVPNAPSYSPTLDDGGRLSMTRRSKEFGAL
jgi:hypothetical protein